jgi:hypothetical protein
MSSYYEHLENQLDKNKEDGLWMVVVLHNERDKTIETYQTENEARKAHDNWIQHYSYDDYSNAVFYLTKVVTMGGFIKEFGTKLYQGSVHPPSFLDLDFTLNNRRNIHG